jgi:dTDP-4-amino-4,6-dideoxygalactose transaminase
VRWTSVPATTWSFTFYATAEAVPPADARPVFCDVDPETMCVTA